MLLIYHVYNNSVYHCLLQAAHAVLQLQELGKPVYKVKNVSLNALCEMYDAPVNPMKDQLKNVYRRDQRYWARRPLTRDMMLYAAADVLALVPQVYNAMTRSVAVLWLILWKGPTTAIVEAVSLSVIATFMGGIKSIWSQILELAPRFKARLSCPDLKCTSV